MSAKRPAQKGVDLGVLQTQAESKYSIYKSTQRALQKAIEANNAAEADYANAKKALEAGVEQVKAATRIL